jgi:putative SOS response-associated peptidase YedK
VVYERPEVSSVALIVRERDNAREAAMAKWGLLPHWAKDSKVAFKMINARAETLTEKPAYRSLIGTHRCLIPANGFYEWTLVSEGKKHPINLHLPGYELFAFAGLWTSRTDEETGEIIRAARSSLPGRTSWWPRYMTGCR